MVAWLRPTEKWRWKVRGAPTRIQALELWEVELPPGDPERRLGQTARMLSRRGIRRVIPPAGWWSPGELVHYGLSPVDPLPLCRRKGDALALELMAGIPLRQRCLALRGAEADPDAWRLAQALCPQVGMLALDFDRGEEELARRLRRAYGAAALHLGQGQTPQVSLELAPRPGSVGRTIRLWGRPELEGFTLVGKEPLPEDLEPLPFLELLWETGRLAVEEIRVERGRNGLDIRRENTYNTG